MNMNLNASSLFTYGAIALTGVILAAATIYDAGDSSGESESKSAEDSGSEESPESSSMFESLTGESETKPEETEEEPPKEEENENVSSAFGFGSTEENEPENSGFFGRE